MNKLKTFHLLFGLLDLIATGTAFFLSLNVVVLFFSYFTVLSNILIILIFLSLVVINKPSKKFNFIRGAATLYMTITGVIYWSILVNQHSLSLDPWINMTMHGITPIVAVTSWILFPPNQRFRSSDVIKWLVAPLLFVIYTLIHGSIINWYPYPFLSPIISGGYFQVWVNVLLIIIGSFVAGSILIHLSNSKLRK